MYRLAVKAGRKCISGHKTRVGKRDRKVVEEGARIIKIVPRFYHLSAVVGNEFSKSELEAASQGGDIINIGLGKVVAAFVAPFASSLPDGLDKTAQTLGFAGRARALWHAPMSEYGLPWTRLALVAPAVAGLIGTVAVALLAWAIGRSLAIRDDASHR